jgi:hypothetical protein
MPDWSFLVFCFPLLSLSEMYWASGLNLQDRLSQISDSIARVEGKKPFHQH